MEIDPRRAEVFNQAINNEIAVHLFGANAAFHDVGAMNDSEFLIAVQSGQYHADNRPINPISIVGEVMLGREPEPGEIDKDEVLGFMYDAYKSLLQQYAENGVDPTAALFAATDIISHTEAYITGYSRELGIMAAKLVAKNASNNGLERWITKLWVPEEDMHDRALAFQGIAATNNHLESWYNDHAHHVQTGMHVPLEDFIQATAYLALQEGSTGPSYKGYSSLLGPVLGKIPKGIGAQEDRHTRFYGRVFGALMGAFPDEAVVALAHEEAAFEMPGMLGIPDFADKAAVAGLTGILDPAKILGVQIPLNKRLDIAYKTFSTDEAKRAKDVLVDPEGNFSKKMLDKRERQLTAVRSRAISNARNAGQLLPAIVGVTVQAHPVTGELSFPAV